MVYARSAGPASLSGCCVDERSCRLIRKSPVLTSEPHAPSSTVGHGDGRFPAKRRALHGSRIARVSPRVLPGISTCPSYFILRLTSEGIGTGGFDNDVGGGVAPGAGTGGAAASAEDDPVMDTYIGMGT